MGNYLTADDNSGNFIAPRIKQPSVPVIDLYVTMGKCGEETGILWSMQLLVIKLTAVMKDFIYFDLWNGGIEGDE